MLTLRDLALLGLLACAPAGLGRSEGALLSAETVRAADFCGDRARDCPRWAPYQRLSDEPWGQIWWLVSTSGYACEIAPSAPYRVGELWECRWRPPRLPF